MERQSTPNMVLHTVQVFLSLIFQVCLAAVKRKRHYFRVNFTGFVPEQFLRKRGKKRNPRQKGLRGFTFFIFSKGTPLWHKYSTLFESIGIGIAAPPDFRVLYTSCNFKVLPLPAAGTVIFTYNNALILCQQYMSGI